MNKKSDFTKEISSNVKKYRLINNLTQAQLAEMLYIDTQYYAQLERGERSFTIEKLIMICDIFQIGIEKIITTNKIDETDNSKLIKSINNQLDTLSHSQLIVVEKFINDIVPCID